MPLSKSALQIIALVIIFGAFAGYSFMNAAWTPPTGTPPANNVDAPINVGTITQEKLGTLGVNGLAVFGASSFTGVATFNNKLISNSNSPALELIDASPGEIDWRLGVENGDNLVFRADRNRDSTWSDVDGSNHPLYLHTDVSGSDDFAKFSNKVRATEYCNSDGSQCAPIEDLINLLPNASCEVEFTYDIDGLADTKVESVSALEGGIMALGIYTRRGTDDQYYADATTKLSDELLRRVTDCKLYDYNTTCERTILGYADPAEIATNPTYDYDQVWDEPNDTGLNSYPYGIIVVATLELKTGSTKTIVNPPEGGITTRSSLSAKVISCIK